MVLAPFKPILTIIRIGHQGVFIFNRSGGIEMKHAMKNFFSLIVFLFIGSANAAVMTFNGTASHGSYTSLPGSYSESGFTMTNNSGANYFIDNWYLELNSWDDDVVEFNSLTDSQITFTSNGGGVFDFTSAYLGSDFYNAASLKLEGFFDGGGSIAETFSLAENTRSLFNFSGFENLTHLVVSAPTDGYYAIMDDFTFNESISVPEPAAVPSPGSLPLMGLGGLLAFGFLRRRDSGLR
jgi:MYXO-CTERM domain-containing protein